MRRIITTVAAALAGLALAASTSFPALAVPAPAHEHSTRLCAGGVAARCLTAPARRARTITIGEPGTRWVIVPEGHVRRGWPFTADASSDFNALLLGEPVEKIMRAAGGQCVTDPVLPRSNADGSRVVLGSCRTAALWVAAAGVLYGVRTTDRFAEPEILTADCGHLGCRTEVSADFFAIGLQRWKAP